MIERNSFSYWIYLIFFIPILILIPGITRVPINPSSEFSDFSITHLPNILFIQNSILTHHQIPLWNPIIFSGYPFDADPLSGLHYLPFWLALPFPQPLGLNLIVICHLVFGGVGMFILLRELGTELVYSILGGLIFEASPKIFGHLANGHITMVMAVSWTPWLFLVIIQLSKKMTLKKELLAGLIFSQIILVDIRWAFYVGIGWVIYWVWNTFQGEKKTWIKRLGVMVFSSGLGVLIASGLLLPLFLFFLNSSRMSMSWEEGMALSLPPVRLLNFIYPDWGGFGEWQIYIGSVPFFLSLVFFFSRESLFTKIKWGGSFLLLILWSLGENGPFSFVFEYLPFLQYLRVPPRIFNWLGLLLAMILSLNSFKKWSDLYVNQVPKAALLGIFFAGLLGLILGIVIRNIQGSGINGFIWGGGALLLVFLLSQLRKNDRITQQTWAISIIGLYLADVMVVNSFGINFIATQNQDADSKKVMTFIRNYREDLPYRIYSPSYSVSQETAVQENLFLVDGVNPMQLTRYIHYFTQASGVPYDAYSVTLPPYYSGDPSSDNQDYHPSAHKLGRLGVKFVVSEFPISTLNLDEVYKSGSKRVYVNGFYQPMAVIMNPDGEGGYEPAEILKYSPNQIQIRTTKEGLLVLSEIYYPGWYVTIDGIPAVIEENESLFRSVQVGPGEHILEFIYIPLVFIIGLGISFLIVIVLLSILFRNHIKST